MDARMNNDLFLRESLAIERTKLANERTLLSYIRTSLYFSIAGISINSLLDLSYGRMLEIAFLLVSVALLVIGVIKYSRVNQRIKDSEKQIVIQA